MLVLQRPRVSSRVSGFLDTSSPFQGFQAGCHVVLRGRRGTLWHSNLFDTVPKMSKLKDVSHEMLFLLRPPVSSRVSGFLDTSPCLWGKLQNLSFSKVSKQVVMPFCVAGVVSGFLDASPCLWGKLQNLSFSKVSKQVVMSFCVASVALCDVPTRFIPCRNFLCVAGATMHSTLCTLHFTLHTPHSTLYTPHSTLYTPHSTLYTLHFSLLTTFYTPNSTLCTPHSTLNTLHSTLHTLHSTLHTPHSTLYTPHSTLYTPHSTLYTPHSTLHTLHSTLHTLHFTLYTPHFTLCTPHSTLYTPHSTLHTLHSRLHTLHSTLYTLHSTLYTPHSTLYTLHSTLYTLHSTLYTLHSTLYTFHSTLQTGNRGNMYKTVQINSCRKVFLRDCISMCFDICTINIRVSIRVRGLHLVSILFEMDRTHSCGNGRIRGKSLEDAWAGKWLACPQKHAVIQHVLKKGKSQLQLLSTNRMSTCHLQFAHVWRQGSSRPAKDWQHTVSILLDNLARWAASKTASPRKQFLQKQLSGRPWTLWMQWPMDRNMKSDECIPNFAILPNTHCTPANRWHWRAVSLADGVCPVGCPSPTSADWSYHIIQEK